MNAPDAQGPPAPDVDAARLRVRLGAVMLVLGAIAAYAGSFGGPFLFDDIGSIPDNPTIRHLWPIWAPLSPPSGGFTVSGRPVLNLSLAINYALGGLNVWGYHAGNLLIHILAGLTLFGIVRRTLPRGHPRGQGADGDIAPRDITIRALTPSQAPLSRWSALSSTRSSAGPGNRVGDNALHLSFIVALLWTVHPLQTESVTYIIQRAESLMGLFYLLTIYGFIRYAEEKAESGKRKAENNARESEGENAESQGGSKFPLYAFRFPLFWRFSLLSFVACLLGMATKEVMVTAPIVVFLYDRTFVSGTFREAWRRHKTLHAGLAATWLLLAWLVVSTGGRAGTAGFQAGVAWWAYALTQFRAVAHYMSLSLWPHPLVGDYGRFLGGPPLEVIGDALIVTALVAGTCFAVFSKRKPNLRPLGFCGAWFFLILAPSSSVLPISTEIIAEHRMYLPLAPVIVVAVIGVASVFGRRRRGQGADCDIAPRDITIRALTPWLFVLAIASAFIVLTSRRNTVYQSNLAFWGDAAAKIPENAGAHNNLGNTLAERGFLQAAIAQYREALRLVPDFADAHADLGNALVKEGHFPEAIENYRIALRFRPQDSAVHYGLGLALLRSGKGDEALPEFREAVRLKPSNAEAWSNLADLLTSGGRWAEAADAYGAASRLHPDNADLHLNYGNVLAELGRRPEAVQEYQAALNLQPGAADVHNNLGTLLAESGRLAEAKAEFQEALRLKPDYQEAHDNLERVNQMERAQPGL